tara:strand:+ start:2825 stop:3049 length:225 start_codon:yes stop_codon:yes gene_type:complete
VFNEKILIAYGLWGSGGNRVLRQIVARVVRVMQNIALVLEPIEMGLKMEIVIGLGTRKYEIIGSNCMGRDAMPL